jgi:hypothetical protein
LPRPCALELVDQAAGVKARQIGQRLAVNLAGQRFQPLTPHPLDRAGDPMGVLDLLLGGTRAIAVSARAVSIGAGGRMINFP